MWWWDCSCLSPVMQNLSVDYPRSLFSVPFHSPTELASTSIRRNFQRQLSRCPLQSGHGHMTGTGQWHPEVSLLQERENGNFWERIYFNPKWMRSEGGEAMWWYNSLELLWLSCNHEGNIITLVRTAVWKVERAWTLMISWRYWTNPWNFLWSSWKMGE